jgi:hypothetical protein
MGRGKRKGQRISCGEGSGGRLWDRGGPARGKEAERKTSVSEKKTDVERRTFRNNTYTYLKVTIHGDENVSDRELDIPSKSSKNASYEGSPTFSFDYPMNMCYVTYDGAGVFTLECEIEYKDRYKFRTE